MSIGACIAENQQNMTWFCKERVLSAEWDLQDRLFSEDKMYSFVKEAAEAKGMSLTRRALAMMKKYHEGQYRKGKDRIPYINHPLSMACHAFALGISEDAVIAAILLHDVVEDCGVPAEALDTSQEVKEAVSLLTFSQHEGQSREEAKNIYFKRLSENRLAVFVKLLDRCNNISTMVTGFSKAKMISYIRETESMVFPLLEQVSDDPEYSSAAFLLKYQMKSVIETIKRLL